MTCDEPDRFQAQLASLDRKMGRTVSVKDWRRVGATAASHPEALSDDDLLVLAAFAGEAHAKQAADRRAHALAPARPSEPTPQPTHTERATVKMTPTFLKDLANAVAGGITAAVDGPRVAGKIATLEARIAALESRPQLTWAGVHAAGTTYPECALVTRGGSLWLAQRTTATTPGSEGSDWRLVVKQGSVR
jgi:hypothetical protein